MLQRPWVSAAVVGLCLGFVLSRVEVADAARNSSGTHSLPTGNPVVSGAAISSTVHNNTMSDLSSEITDSLSRSGKGAMLAPLELANGSTSLPAISFDSDTNTGCWRKGADNLACGVAGAEVIDLQATGADVTGALAVSGAATVGTTLGVTGAITASSTLAVTSTTALTGGVSTNIALTGSDPTSSTGFTDTITPMNVAKAWGRVTGNGGSASTILAGFNVTNITDSGDNLVVDIVSDFANNDTYACVATSDASGKITSISNNAAGQIILSLLNHDGTGVTLSSSATRINFVCYGAN